jgi:hypothetical protein
MPVPRAVLTRAVVRGRLRENIRWPGALCHLSSIFLRSRGRWLLMFQVRGGARFSSCLVPDDPPRQRSMDASRPVGPAPPALFALVRLGSRRS